MSQQQPFDPNEFAQWIVDGLKETIAYRIKNTLSREKIIELIQESLPNRVQVFHHLLRKSFEKANFQFETIQHGDACIQLIRKKYREDSSDQKPIRRFLIIPGFGDTPASWIPSYAFARRDFLKNFDEVMILDFPGYLGFSSRRPLIPSMASLQSVIRTIIERYPPTVLVGHSLGGWLAGKVSQSLNTLLEHLILISPSGLIPPLEREAFGESILKHGGQIEELLASVVHQPRKYHQWIREDMHEFFLQPEVREFIYSVKEEHFIDPNLPFHAKKISLIWGDQDRFVPAQWVRHWVEHYGEVLDVFLMHKTGHLPQIERPKVFANVLLQIFGNLKDAKGNHWKRTHSRRKTQNFDLPNDRAGSPGPQRLLNFTK